MHNPLFLLPPSEGKKQDGTAVSSTRRFTFSLPLDIAKNATPKDLKCKDKRYEEGISLNHTVQEGPYLPAIQRYTGVMFNAIEYGNLSGEHQTYFDNHVCIISGLYGLLCPQDMIANYKLPIQTKGLYAFRGDILTKGLQDFIVSQKFDCIVDLLPGAHKKLFRREELSIPVVSVDFYTQKDDQYKKMTHGVKKVKGQRLKTCCEKQSLPDDFSLKNTTYNVMNDA